MSDDNGNDRVNPTPTPRFHPYTLEEMSTIAKRQETEPWPAKEALAAIDGEFRHGYVDGWREAIDALFDLLGAETKALQQPDVASVFDSARAHLEFKLYPWEKAAHFQVHGHKLFTYGVKREGPAEIGGDWPPALRPD